MSPTPIASPASSFARLTYGSAQRGAMTDEQIWPLRPPPCLHSPVFPVKELIKNDANDRSSNFASLSSISAPQSPRSTRKFDVRGILCGLSSPTHKVFDPFLVAMEKAMEKATDDFAVLDMRNLANKEAPRKTDVRHRRTRSSSPLKVFHWDDNASKSNSSSNGSSSMDEAKSKHPLQREIDARHIAKPLKGLRRWRFMGFLHRKCESVGANLEHGNRSSSMRSTGYGSITSGASRRESCSSETVFMDMSNRRDCAHVPPPSISSPSSSSKPFPLPSPAPAKLSASSLSSSSSRSSALSPSPSTKLPTLSPSSSTSSAKGKLNVHHHRNGSRGPYAIHYDIQKAHSEELKKKTFLPYRQGLLGCLGLSSRGYRAIATLSKPLQSVS
ncbi:hypothetical protein KP509_06G065900 [Ceratopteris richardii]|nr:hypothetical protein KP509_06G065900 [Ceratopteris richardii]